MTTYREPRPSARVLSDFLLYHFLNLWRIAIKKTAPIARTKAVKTLATAVFIRFFAKHTIRYLL